MPFAEAAVCMIDIILPPTNCADKENRAETHNFHRNCAALGWSDDLFIPYKNISLILPES